MVWSMRTFAIEFVFSFSRISQIMFVSTVRLLSCWVCMVTIYFPKKIHNNSLVRKSSLVTIDCMYRNNNHSNDVLSDNDRKTNYSTSMGICASPSLSLTCIQSFLLFRSQLYFVNIEMTMAMIHTVQNIFIHIYITSIQCAKIVLHFIMQQTTVGMPFVHNNCTQLSLYVYVYATYHHHNHHLCLRRHIEKKNTFMFHFFLCFGFALFCSNNFIHSLTHHRTHIPTHERKNWSRIVYVFTDNF